MDLAHCLLTDSRVVSTIGLLFDILGAVVLAWGLFVSKKEAIRLGGTSWMPSGDSDDDELLKEPPIANFLLQSKRAKIGLGLLVLGFILQILGAWVEPCTAPRTPNEQKHRARQNLV